MRLTDLSIKALKAPAKGAIIYPDDVLTGFGVRVSEGGTKSFVLTHGALRRRETIGRVGILGLQSARTEAKRRLAEYTLGKAQPRVVPWNTALEEYLKELGANRKARTHRDYARILRKHFRFGELKLPQLGQADIERKLERLHSSPNDFLDPISRFSLYFSLLLGFSVVETGSHSPVFTTKPFNGLAGWSRREFFRGSAGALAQRNILPNMSSLSLGSLGSIALLLREVHSRAPMGELGRSAKRPDWTFEETVLALDLWAAGGQPDTDRIENAADACWNLCSQ